MRVSFTETMQGMNVYQLQGLEELLILHKNRMVLFAHGCCVGADIQAHFLARKICGPSLFIAVYPSTAKTRAPIPVDADFVAEPKPPLVRDKDIVNAGRDMLIAAPLQMREIVRSGTWTTYRYAKKKNIEVRMLWREIG